MNRETQSVVVALLGGLLISITVSGRFTSYVTPGLAPMLLGAGIVLLLVGVISLIMSLRQHEGATVAAPTGRSDVAAATSHEAHGHSHDTSRAPWLVIIPVLVLLLVAPPALGSDAVSRTATTQAAPKRTMTFPALPDGAEPAVEMKDFVLRALYDADNSLEGVPVTVTGFIAPAGDGFQDGYGIARMVISCCAADANAMQVHVAGDAPFPSDTWVQAVVTAVPDTATLDNRYVLTVDVGVITPIGQPADPYEH